MAKLEKRSWHWKEKYNTTQSFYKNYYDERYYDFGKYELEIDPDETLEDLNDYTFTQQQQEIIKCKHSFPYFCHKFVKISHSILGLLPFVLFKYQKKVVKQYEEHRLNIIRKFRQGGLSTLTVIWCLWRCMFIDKNETILIASKTDREAVVAGEIAKTAMNNFPDWLTPEKTKSTAHETHFLHTGSKLLFYTPEAVRGRSLTFLIIDEAAYVKDMHRHWAALYPTLSTGGSCIVVSTVNGMGNWYEETYHDAEEGRNTFHIIDIEFNEHPDYDFPDWAKEMEANLGTKRFRQEILGDFQGSSSTYINADYLKEIKKNTKATIPKRILFSEWANFSKSMKELGLNANPSSGALWIFEEPLDGREYIMGVDCAEGGGEEGDNSCFQVIDSTTLEQVAEFYSNSITPERFSKIISQIGIFYNQALIVIENMGPGLTILSRLQNELYYDNLHHENVKNIDKPGIKVGPHNRSTILDALQSRLLDKSIKLNSIRTAIELETFIYSPSRKRYEAQKGKHDDAIFALAHAVHIREKTIRITNPILSEIPKELSEIFKSEIYTKIKEEIFSTAPEEWVDPEDRIDFFEGDDDNDSDKMLSRYRRHDSLLREFNW